MKKLFFVSMLTLSATFCHAGTIQWGIAGWEKAPFLSEMWKSEYYLGITTPNGSISVGCNATFSFAQATIINNYDRTTGLSVNLLPITCGTWVDNNLFNESTGPFFSTYDSSNNYISETNLYIPKTNDSCSNTYLLAFKAFGSFDYVVYGWIELGYDGTNVFIMNSAEEITGNGILAQRSTCIPEPSTALLALSGSALFLLRRRRIII